MKRNILLLAIMCAISGFTFTSFAQVAVTVTAPLNGATVSAPVTVQAHATTSSQISSWRIYLDGTSVYRTGSTLSINTSLSMSPGTHKITVRAWAINGTRGSSTTYITVPQATAPPIAIAISPTSVTLQSGLTYQFTASVTGTTNTAKTWSVNGVLGGSSAIGTISSTGLYAAPASVPSGGSVTVKATSSADNSKSATAVVTVVATPTAVNLTLSPTSASVQAGQTQQFAAAVTGTTNNAVNWYVAGIQGGSASVGTISSSGLYTAPICPSVSTQTVTARSAYDSNATANATLTLSAAPAGGADYYVATTGSNSNDGSACRPWASIQHAATAATAGKTVHVAPGTYNENVVITNVGTSTQRIRFISDARWGAKVVAANNNPVIFLTNGSSYVDIVGFDISGPSAGSGIDVSDQAGIPYSIYILGNYIHDVSTALGCTSGGGVALQDHSGGVRNSQVIGNRINNIGAPGLAATCNQDHGIYASNGTIVENNVISNSVGWGIQYYAEACFGRVTHNTIFHNGHGGVIIGGESTSTCHDYNTLSNNIIANNGAATGVYGGIATYGPLGESNSVYQNNVMFGNVPGNFSYSGGATTQPPTSGTLTSGSNSTVFVSYLDDGTGDYHLRAGSPAVDVGTTACAPTVTNCVPNIDVSGGARPQGVARDAGAYEYGSTAAQWPWY